MRYFPGFAVAVLFFTLQTVAAYAADFSGKVQVLDGNTLKFGDTEVALWSLNAPLSDEQCVSTKGKPFPCGKTAFRTLDMLIQNRPIECDIQGDAKDKMNRPLVVCFLQGMDINEQMVLTGWAVILPDESNRYARSQYAAKKTRSGMWRSLRFKPEDINGRK